MKRRVFDLAVLLLVVVASSRIAGAAQRPNVLFILTDDQAPWALGLAGHPHAETGNLDQLFRQGAYLVNAYTTTPVCSPSRAGLMTSRYGTELGITDWIHPGREPELGLDPATITWPELLQKAGYNTALIGKWHLGVPDRFHPNRTGFDHFVGFRAGGTVLLNPKFDVNGTKKRFEGFTTNILTDQAIEFLQSGRDKTKPFLLCVHYRAPHAPWLPLPEEDWQPFESLDPTIPNPHYPKLDTKRVKRITREYLGSVKSVDRNVGRLLTALKSEGEEQNTIVIFTSDHGYNVGHNAVLHKGNGHWILTDPPPGTDNVPRGQRPNMYDTSLRVPTAIRWPGVIAEGTRITNTVTNLDWYPTLLAMARVELPAGVILRGRDFTGLLRGENLEWDNDLYAQYSTHHTTHTHMRVYRTGEWKLVRDFLNPERDELYNVKNDPAERTNLIKNPAPEVQAVVKRLDRKIRENMQRIGDKVSLPAAGE